jgi:Mce-associated membrane protein
MPKPSVRSRRLPWLLLVLAVAAAVTFGWLWWGERAEDARREDVEATAAGFLLALTNFDAATIDADVREIRSYAIGQFADEVDQTFNADRVAAIREGQASSAGTMRSLFVQELGQDTATVFAVVDETTSNSSSPAPRQDVLRVEVELIETEGGWKVNRVEILQSLSGGLVG